MESSLPCGFAALAAGQPNGEISRRATIFLEAIPRSFDNVSQAPKRRYASLAEVLSAGVTRNSCPLSGFIASLHTSVASRRISTAPSCISHLAKYLEAVIAAEVKEFDL
jgi:hypothetical protein